MNRLYCYYHLSASLVFGIANVLMPVDILTVRVERGGGDSLSDLYEFVSEARVAERDSLSNPPSSTAASSSPAPSASPYAVAVAPALASESNRLSQQRLLQNNIQLNTLAALISTSLLQLQLGAVSDTATAAIAYQLLSDHSPSTRRALHRVLSLLKISHYSIYLVNELAVGSLSILTLLGLGIETAAFVYWGLPPAPAVSSSDSSASLKDDHLKALNLNNQNPPKVTATKNSY